MVLSKSCEREEYTTKKEEHIYYLFMYIYIYIYTYTHIRTISL